MELNPRSVTANQVSGAVWGTWVRRPHWKNSCNWSLHLLGFPITHCLLWWLTWEVNGNEVGIVTPASFTPLMVTLTSASFLVRGNAFDVLFWPWHGISYQNSSCSMSVPVQEFCPLLGFLFQLFTWQRAYITTGWAHSPTSPLQRWTWARIQCIT